MYWFSTAFSQSDQSVRKTLVKPQDMVMTKVFLLTLFATVSVAFANADDHLLVQTSSGLVQGKYVTTFTHKTARAFYGIPYAEPPVKELRFRPPVPFKPRTDVFDATKPGLPCYQHHSLQSLKTAMKAGSYIPRPWSEDCLTLNVWVTNEDQLDAPVFIYIHSGGFQAGTAGFPSLDLSTMAAEANFIVIAANYRLGPFGFLSLGLPDFSGNLGLMDQRLALLWVRQNAVHFGGKTEAIFFVGTGAGAASIGHHVIYEQNAGLFKTAALAGGSPISSWAWQTKEKALLSSKALSEHLGCENVSVLEELQCLQHAHPEDILDASLTLGIDRFVPNIDGTFIKESPRDAMKALRFNNVTIIVMNAPKDGALVFRDLNEDLLTEPGPGLTLEGFRKALRRVGLARTDTELKLIQQWYLNESCSGNEIEIRNAAVEAYGDGLFFCATYEMLNRATEKGVLTYMGILGSPDPNLPEWVAGHHRSSLPLMTGDALDPKRNFGPAIMQSAIGMLRTGGYYARKKAIEFQELMPLYNLEERPYLLWTSKITHLKNYKRGICVLWDEILPAVRRSTSSCTAGNNAS